jgi:hypothetical protein
MRRNEALEAAIDECRKLGVEFRIEAVKTSNHVRLLIEGCKRVLTVSNTHAIKSVRTDVRRAARGI